MHKLLFNCNYLENLFEVEHSMEQEISDPSKRRHKYLFEYCLNRFVLNWALFILKHLLYSSIEKIQILLMKDLEDCCHIIDKILFGKCLDERCLLSNETIDWICHFLSLCLFCTTKYSRNYRGFALTINHLTNISLYLDNLNFYCWLYWNKQNFIHTKKLIQLIFSVVIAVIPWEITFKLTIINVINDFLKLFAWNDEKTFLTFIMN